MDFSKTVVAMGSAIGARELIKAVEGFSLNDALSVVGLERKPSSLLHLLPTIGLITVSAAVGASVALLLAPSSGKRLRARLADGIDDAKLRLSDRIGQLDTSRRHAIS